ncbi:MAG: TetR/AcrR family transcriptional regulator [Desulforhopalus sp.]|nr:TetR/AcrR family transcriptional regulator [Desulforhopalus sp.]
MNLKDKLLCEALRQFSVKGYAATSTSSIIEGVGASKGGLYNHFHNKEELFLEALSLARKLWRERNLAGLAEIERPIDRILALLANYRDRYLSDSDNLPGGCVFVNLAVELSDEHPHLGREVSQGFGKLRTMIEDLFALERQQGTLAASADPAAAAEIVCAGILGACVVYSSDKSRPALDRTINALMQYVEGLKA